MRKDQASTWNTNSLRTVGVVLAWTCLGLALPLAATGCGHKHASAEEGKKNVVEVATTSPQRRDLIRDIEQPGFLMPWEVTPIYAKISGFAEKFEYDLGARVLKGQVLVKLRVPEVDQELLVKQARVEQAVADVEQALAFEEAAKEAVNAAKADIKAKTASIRSADADVERWKAEADRSYILYTQKVYDLNTLEEVRKQHKSSEALRDETIAKLDYANAKHLQAIATHGKAKADVKVSRASLRVAQAAEKQWAEWLDYKYIRAPYDGLVTLRNVAEGDFLQATNSGSTSKSAEPVFIMMNTSVMRCTVEIPEMDALLLKDGDVAEINFQAMPGAPTIGKVKRNADSLDSHSRTLRIEVDLDNADNRYKPHMYLKVTIRAKMPKTWSLPASAVMNDILAHGDRKYCVVVEDGKARKMFLEVGQPCEDGMLPIIRKQRAGSRTWENISGQEIVVTTNAQALLDGQPVAAKAP
jgi:RND family efflux transporter MFP subunit